MPVTTPPWLEVVDEATKAATSLSRPDLADLLRRKRARLLDPTLRVLVIGEPNQGKSQLVNALVNAPVCAVGDDVTTAAPTVVQHAEQPSATLIRQEQRVPVPIEHVAEAQQGAAAVAAEVGIPRRLLESGLVLVDSPAIDNPRRPDFVALVEADVVLLATDATAELSAAELVLLRELVQTGADVVVAVTKIDLVPHWRQLAERNRSRLTSAGVPATVVPVSAALRLHAARTGDSAVNVESGFGGLIELLQQRSAAKHTVLAPRAAAVVARFAVHQLVGAMRAKIATAVAAPPAQPPLQTQRRLEDLRRSATRVQTMLADEMADLGSDLDFDLRDRARRILREVDRTFEKSDPAKCWDEFEEWLQANLAEAAQANFQWLVQRCHWIAEKLTDAFPDYPVEAAPEQIPAMPDGPLDDLGELEFPNLERFPVGQKMFTGLRGSYGGVLMFGLATSLLAGLPLINPISIGAGALFGGKSVMEESESRLRRRQSAAKTAAQRHVDDFFLKFGKDCKDVTRHIQRGLRDHFAELAIQRQEVLSTSMMDARQANADRDHEQRRMARELDELVNLRNRIEALAA